MLYFSKIQNDPYRIIAPISCIMASFHKLNLTDIVGCVPENDRYQYDIRLHLKYYPYRVVSIRASTVRKTVPCQHGTVRSSSVYIDNRSRAVPYRAVLARI